MVQHSQGILNSLSNSIDMSGYGLEVSPYYEPCISKSSHNVVYTDYLDNDAIQAKALENPELNGKIVPLIDFVWEPEKRLMQCMHSDRKFEYIVASHVMEHVANPLGWLRELLSALNIGGRVALFLPDRRFTSDYLRNESNFGQLLQWWIEQPSSPTIGQVLDFMSHGLSLTHDTAVKWNDPEHTANLPLHYTFTDMINTGTALYNDRPYIDVHCTVWTSESFARVFKQVEDSGIIGVRLVDVISDEGEFLAILEKVAEPAFVPVALKTSSIHAGNGQHQVLESIDHKIDILRHDLTHLIQKTHEATGTINRSEELIRALNPSKGPNKKPLFG